MRYLLLLLIILFFSCSQKEAEGNYNDGRIDISSDSKYILYAFHVFDSSNIYKYSIANRTFELLYSSKANLVGCPKFYNTEKTIVFLEYSGGDKEVTSFVLYDITNKTKTVILKNESIVQDFIFSKSRKYLYFIQANSFGHSSPIGVDAPHNMDIYSIALDSKKVKKITNLNAYSINGLSISKNDSSIMTSVMDLGGMCRISTRTGKCEKVKIKNDPRLAVASLYRPIYTSDDSLIFYEASYEINSYDLSKGESKIVVSHEIMPGNPYSLCVDSNNTNLYFTSDGNGIYRYSIPNSMLEALPIYYSKPGEKICLTCKEN